MGSLEHLACAYAAAGRLDDARRVLTEMHAAGAKNSFLPATPIAAVNAALGEIDTAVEWVEKAIEQREPIITILKVWPAFDPIRSHPRYPGLLKQMNLA
jgi:pentatricopeptide repeat protein